MSAPLSRGEAGEVLRQASAVLGRPVTLWEVTGAHEAVPRATSDPNARPLLPSFDLDATLRRWKVAIPIGSRWVAAPGPTPDAWVVAPVRSHPPAPPPGGRERRSRERLALELAGLALGLIERTPGEAGAGSAERRDPLKDLPGFPAMIAHEANNPLAAARTGLQLAMEAIGRWVDLAADRRLALLDDLGQVLEDVDRATEFVRAIQDRARGAVAGVSPRSERFDVVRVVRSCLTLERRLLRDRGIDLDFSTALEETYLKGDPNALFDLLVNLVRNAADATAQPPTPVVVRLTRKGRELEISVGGKGGEGGGLAKVRSVAEGVFAGSVRVESEPKNTTYTVVLPLPPQREGSNAR